MATHLSQLAAQSSSALVPYCCLLSATIFASPTSNPQARNAAQRTADTSGIRELGASSDEFDEDKVFSTIYRNAAGAGCAKIQPQV
jgi:hypothetical protein